MAKKQATSGVAEPEVLLIDDYPLTRESLQMLLERNGFSVVSVPIFAEAIVELPARRPDAIIFRSNSLELSGRRLDEALYLKTRTASFIGILNTASGVEEIIDAPKGLFSSIIRATASNAGSLPQQIRNLIDSERISATRRTNPRAFQRRGGGPAKPARLPRPV